MPLTCPTEQGLSLYRWKVRRRQLYVVRVSTDENYSANGYNSQTLGFEYDPAAGYNERQRFVLDNGGGGGVQ